MGWRAHLPMAFRDNRVLRYVGNREQPEPVFYDPVEWAVAKAFSLHPLAYQDLKKFAVHVANPLLSDFTESKNGVWVKPLSVSEGLMKRWFTWGIPPAITGFWTGYAEEAEEPEPAPPPVEVDFEVNMMEALVGWKSWFFEEKKGWLESINSCEWTPLERMEAECPPSARINSKQVTSPCTHIPAEYHTCGFYAADEKDGVRRNDEEWDDVVGQVYGWGRYIRGESGWRSQYAYPKSFYLRADQANLVEPLRAYGVPIYLEQSMQVYFPEEDGYGHGQDYQDGCERAVEGSSSAASGSDEASED
jgi:hypothetical protein